MEVDDLVFARGGELMNILMDHHDLQMAGLDTTSDEDNLHELVRLTTSIRPHLSLTSLFGTV